VPPARVLLADDHELMRRMLRLALAARPGLEVVGEAGDGAEALALARELAPDLVVLDVDMPEMNGLEVTRALRASLPDCAVLIVSALEAGRMADAALAAGADRYVEKGAGLDAAADAAAELVSR
jgi:DNA-binding NarL/FixJ family response regulator